MFSCLSNYFYSKESLIKMCKKAVILCIVLTDDERNDEEVETPIGEYIIFEEGLDTYMKYTSYKPKSISLYYYLDLFVPFFDKEGETLSSISAREYNDSRKWRAIADANNIDDPENVSAGTIVELPPLY